MQFNKQLAMAAEGKEPREGNNGQSDRINDAAETILYQLMAPMAAGSPTWLGVESHMGMHLAEFDSERAVLVHGGYARPPALLHHDDAHELSDEDAECTQTPAALPSWPLRQRHSQPWYESALACCAPLPAAGKGGGGTGSSVFGAIRRYASSGGAGDQRSGVAATSHRSASHSGRRGGCCQSQACV
jgi:hypothetical protein